MRKDTNPDGSKICKMDNTHFNDPYRSSGGLPNRYVMQEQCPPL